MLSTLEKGANAIYSSLPTMNNIPNISNLWDKDSNSDTSILTNSQVLQLGNLLNGIFQDSDPHKNSIELPRIVVVGTQSSGKSSLLNGILRMDLLPMGSSMVTRCPIQLQMVSSNDTPRAEFGIYDSGKWSVEKKINLSFPNPTSQEITQFHEEINIQTARRAGNSKNVSYKAILVKVFAKNIPNLSFIDLPGLTMTALTDRGQPRDIKEQVKKMIGSYISEERTIILAVMPARVDLEADPALEMIKEHDPEGKRTIGVMTKIDLMNTGTDVINYLQNDVPADLSLKYGYFAVKNRSHSEMEVMNISEGLTAEKKFFDNHLVYGSRNLGDRLGTHCLSDFLSDILVQHIRKCIPSILVEICRMDQQVDNIVSKLGPPLPENDTGKMSYLHVLLSDFCKEFTAVIDRRSASHNVGRSIKDVLIDFRTELHDINPFVIEEYSDDYIKNCIRNCEGNHMSFPLPSIEVFEHCLRDRTKRPMSKLGDPAISCLGKVSDQINILIDNLLNRENFGRFPNLVNRIKTEVSQIVKRNQDDSIAKIFDLIAMEENYIWTDHIKFNDQLKAMFNNNGTIDPNGMRELLITYYSTVKEVLQNNVPKAIMLFLVKRSKDSVATALFDTLTKEPVGNLLEEPGDINQKREEYHNQKSNLVAIKKALEQFQ
jgi:GTP-binding protein EngB required for normal cell division